MIVNKKSYPTLNDIAKNKLTSIKFMDIDSTYSNSLGRSFFEEQWGRHARLFGKEVLVVSKAYEDAAIRASDKLYNLVESIREKKEFNLSIQGSYIVKSAMFMCDLKFDNTDGFEGVFYIFLPMEFPTVISHYQKEGYG